MLHSFAYKLMQWSTTSPLTTSLADGASESETRVYARSTSTLSELVRCKGFDMLQAMSGTSGLLNDLDSSPQGLSCFLSDSAPQGDGENSGFDEDRERAIQKELSLRRRQYGSASSTRQLSFRSMITSSLMYDNAMLLLFFVNLFPLGLGIWMRVRGRDVADASITDPLSLSLGIFCIGFAYVLQSAYSSWYREACLVDLDKHRDCKSVTVIRGAVPVPVDLKDVVVGDVVVLRAGEVAPFDGLYLDGHDVRCDESSLPGGSDTVYKLSFEDCHYLQQTVLNDSDTEDSHATLNQTDCFILSGSLAMDGVCTYLVLAVGPRTVAVSFSSSEVSPLQKDVDWLSTRLSSCVLVLGTLLFLTILLKFIIRLPWKSSFLHGVPALVEYVLLAVTLLIVGSPAGLALVAADPLAVVASRLKDSGIHVHRLASLETFANVSSVCVSQIDCLFSGSGRVVAGSIGCHRDSLRVNTSTSCDPLNTYSLDDGSERLSSTPFYDHLQGLSSPLLSLYREALEIGSSHSHLELIGGASHIPLLRYMEGLGWNLPFPMPKVVYEIPAAYDRKLSGVVIQTDGLWRLYLKGSSDILVRRCVRQVVPTPVIGPQSTYGIVTEPMDAGAVLSTAEDSAQQGLDTIVLCYRDFASWPPAYRRADPHIFSQPRTIDLLDNLVYIGSVSIRRNLDNRARSALTKCRQAGISVKLCTSADIAMAHAYARECGISIDSNVWMSGDTFRESSHLRLSRTAGLQVLFNASTDYIQTLINEMKELGHVVCAFGDVRLVKGAPISIMADFDDNGLISHMTTNAGLPSFMGALLEGRHIKDTTRQMAQYQLTSGIASILLICFSPVRAVLSPFHFLWIGVITDMLSSFVLAHEHPHSRRGGPETLNTPLVSSRMVTQVAAQVLHHTITVIVIHTCGHRFLGLHSGCDHHLHSPNTLILQTLAFNTLAFAHIFNSVNSRQTGDDINIFAGVTWNTRFFLILSVSCVQIIFVEFGASTGLVASIGARGWCISLLAGFATIPIGVAVRMTPIDLPESFLRIVGLALKSPTPVLPLARNDISLDSIQHSSFSSLTRSSHLSGPFIRPLTREHYEMNELFLLNFCGDGSSSLQLPPSSDEDLSVLKPVADAATTPLAPQHDLPYELSGAIHTGELDTAGSYYEDLSASWSSTNSSQSWRWSEQNYEVDTDEVIRQLEHHLEAISSAFDLVGERLAELIIALQHADSDVTGPHQRMFRLSDMIAASRSTAELIAALSRASRLAPVYLTSGTNSSTSFYSISTGGSESIITAALYDSLSSDDTFYSAMEGTADALTISERTMTSVGINTIDGLVPHQQGGIQINVYNINMLGDTFNGPIHGGNVGGRLSQSTVFDSRNQLQLEEVLARLSDSLS